MSLRQHFERIDFTIDGVALEVSGSFGCTEIGDNDLLTASSQAEAACRIAKSKGQDCIVHEWSNQDSLLEKEWRFRCEGCGASTRVTTNCESISTLHCPACGQEASVEEASSAE